MFCHQCCFCKCVAVYIGRMRVRSLLLPIALVLTLGLSSPAVVAQEPLPESDPATELYRTARTLEADGELGLADALMDYILRRYPDSAAASAIRTARAAPGSRSIHEDGRTELVVWSTLYGLWLGVAIPGMLGASGSEPYGLGLLVGGPVGFAAARGATANTPIGAGQAEAITWGGSWGTWQGFGWAHVFDPGQNCPSHTDSGFVYCDPGPSTRAVFGWMVAGGLAGTGAGIAAARGRDIPPGDATLVSLGSLWGTWYGVALGVIAGLEDDALLASTLIGGNLGAGTGALLGRAYPVSRTDARIASIIGVVGGLAGAGIDLIVQPSNEKVAMAIPAVTSAFALGLGASRIRLGRASQDREEAGAGGAEWSLGGDIFPLPVRGPNGEYRTALGMTLLSGRF